MTDESLGFRSPDVTVITKADSSAGCYYLRMVQRAEMFIISRTGGHSAMTEAAIVRSERHASMSCLIFFLKGHAGSGQVMVRSKLQVFTLAAAA